MKRFFAYIVIAIVGALFTVNTRAQTRLLTVQSAEKQTALVELFTSEGCSSCPPAEAWLSRQQDSHGLWRDFVPIAFHVDYWDYLGWRDPWAGKKFTERQREYAARWNSESVYTPEFVLNGKEWRDWRGQKEVPISANAKIGVLTATSSDTNHWQVRFAPTAMNGTRYEVHAALLGGGLNSDVKAGENRGRRLGHDFVALEMANAPLVAQDGSATGEVAFGARRNASEGRRLAIAVWITKQGQLEPLQAAGGWLDASPGRLAGPH